MEAYFRENYNGSETELGAMCKDTLDTYRDVTEYANNLRRFPNLTDRVADHMGGLPEPFYPTPYYYEIEELLRDWNIIKESDNPSRVERLKNGWWTYWAGWIIKNARKVK